MTIDFLEWDFGQSYGGGTGYGVVRYDPTQTTIRLDIDGNGAFDKTIVLDGDHASLTDYDFNILGAHNGGTFAQPDS